MMVKAVIFCGGLGTRLREETEFRPKPMVPIGGMPILWHIMKIYSHYGVRDFVLCLGYKGDMIKQFFLSQEFKEKDFTIDMKSGKKVIHNGNETEDWSVTLVETGLNAMTGSRLKQIERYITEDELMVTYGDGVADIDISRLYSHYKEKGKIGTITGVCMPSRYGMIKADDIGLVTDFIEKPVLPDRINGGFLVFKKDVFDYLSLDESCVLEKDVLPRLAKERQLSMFKHDGFWYCMDTYRDYLELNKMWDEGNRPWKVWK